jgi:hypothetical protein
MRFSASSNFLVILATDPCSMEMFSSTFRGVISVSLLSFYSCDSAVLQRSQTESIDRDHNKPRRIDMGYNRSGMASFALVMAVRTQAFLLHRPLRRHDTIRNNHQDLQNQSNTASM